MWLLVFFDLPVKTPAERRAHARFRSYLLKHGCQRLQLSVYCRFFDTSAKAAACAKKMQENAPAGDVRTLLLTEDQIGRMTGEPLERPPRVLML